MIFQSRTFQVENMQEQFSDLSNACHQHVIIYNQGPRSSRGWGGWRAPPNIFKIIK